MRSKRWIQESRGGIQESKEGRGRNVKQLKKYQNRIGSLLLKLGIISKEDIPKNK